MPILILSSEMPLKGMSSRVVLLLVILVSMTIVDGRCHCHWSMIVIIIVVVVLSSALMMHAPFMGDAP